MDSKRDGPWYWRPWRRRRRSRRGRDRRIVVNATDGNDTINVNGDTAGVKESGLATGVKILHSDAANDRLEVNTLAGLDTVDSSGLAPGAIQLFVNGVLRP